MVCAYGCVFRRELRESDTTHSHELRASNTTRRGPNTSKRLSSTFDRYGWLPIQEQGRSYMDMSVQARARGTQKLQEQEYVKQQLEAINKVCTILPHLKIPWKFGDQFYI